MSAAIYNTSESKETLMRLEATKGDSPKVWLIDIEIEQLQRAAASYRDDIIIQLGAYGGLRALEIPQIRARPVKQTETGTRRLLELAPRNHGATPVRYQRLVDLFDVDRRTFRDRYLSALAEFYLLTPVTEYDNARPRSVRLYLRDTGVATALDDGDPRAALRDRDREAALAHLAAFDHTMRFAYGTEAVHGRESPPVVQYWDGEEGTVAFVLEIDGQPVPVALAYRPPADEAQAALEEFLATYDTVVGLLVTGGTVGETDAIGRDGRVVEVPYWLYLMRC